MGNSRPSLGAIMLRTLLLTTFLFFVIIYDKKMTTKPFDPKILHQAFRFHVHCPITNQEDGSFLYLLNHLNISDPEVESKIFNQLIEIPTYVVFIDAFSSDPNDTTNSSVMMSYCGFARLKNQTDCSKAKLLCTVPGPMFIVPVNQTINVIWINSINGEYLNWTETDKNCYGDNREEAKCNVLAKTHQNNADCTFYSPTAPMTSGVKNVSISSKAIPISPHIHGLQNRPSFDGGPFSWFNNAGDKGPGYFSMSTNNYYNSFFKEQLPFLKDLLTQEQASKIKVNQYKNNQPPGMLFYHDHAMKASLTNNLRGFQGFYVIHDPQHDQVYPTNEEEYLFVFHFFNQGDLRVKQDRKYLGEGNPYPFIGPLQDNTFLYGKQHVYRNMTYRWNILNSHFDTTYTNISFATFYRRLKDSEGYLYTEELEPPLNCNNESFFENMHRVNFTVIGTDSAMFSQAVHNIDQFNLASAQRIQLLIKYDEVPQNVSHIYVVAYDNLDEYNDTKYAVKLDLTIHPQPVVNKYQEPWQFNDLNISFTNLSQVPPSGIAKKRMRALLARPFQKLFTINQHTQFTAAASENPQIGTIEDWFIINVMAEVHPMHFHDIHFQIVKSYTLKVIQQGCSLYELDFFRESNISVFQVQDDSELCYLLGNITLDEMMALSDQFNKIYLEDEFIDGISGKNVMEEISNEDDSARYFYPDCPLSTYKYICSDSTDNLPVYERGWKDTAGVAGFEVYVLRIRWTKTFFNPELQNDPYFNYDEAEMLQWPGTLYHCHMLIHVQKKMVRPIMFEPSERFKQTYKSSFYDCNLLNWEDRYMCINNALNCTV